jgi:hypothetical protein
MHTIEILTVIALIVGPISAVQVQKFIEATNDRRNRRIWVFKTLMATRGATLSIDHVSALNRIDLEFSDNDKYKKIIEAWKMYFDNLCIETHGEQEAILWLKVNQDLLADLLYEMGRSLGYNFERSQIKRNIYSPKAHGRMEREYQLIREKLIEMLHGDLSIPVSISSVRPDEEAVERQQKLQDLLIDYYTRENNKNNSKDK